MSEEYKTCKSDVSRMIQQIRDRLDDVEESLNEYTGDLSGYVEKLDRIDDRLFEIELAFEKGEVTSSEKQVGSQGAFDEGSEDEPLITREGIKNATSDINEIYRTGYETVTELAGTVSEIKEALDFKSVFKPKPPQ